MVNQALLERLAQVAPFVLGGDAGVEGPRATLAGALARHLARRPTDEALWLAIVAFTTVFPTIDEHRAVRRRLALAAPGTELRTLLGVLGPLITRAPDPHAALELVVGQTVVDANFSGRFDHNTGIQRVLRETASRWAESRHITLVCWNDSGTAMRRLVGREIVRVTDWATHSSRSLAERQQAEAPDVAAAVIRRTVVVPVRSVIVEIEVAQSETAAALAALAAVSGNRLGLVGHDTIPIVSAAGQDSDEIERFARFLTVVKNSSRVAGVSASAAAEFAGFVSALSAQNVAGPLVVAVPLAMNAPSEAARALAEGEGRASGADSSVSGSNADGASSADRAPNAGRSPDDLPLVLIVGSQEPRKNHDVILFAARRLWSEGLRFRVRFIGGGSSAALSRFDADIRSARAVGLPVEALRGATDAVLLESYRQARFSVFPSLHEGFGLPVAESLALGTPVITSDHGSLLEIAEGGGCLVVDARDDEAVQRAMRRLLAEPQVLDSLRAEALARSFRTWGQYADQLWGDLVEPLHESLEAGEPLAAPQPAPPLRPAPRSAETPRGAAPSGEGIELDRWWGSALEAARVARARENSPLNTVAKIGPLVRFFATRSHEMGVGPASKAAWRVVRRRLFRG